MKRILLCTAFLMAFNSSILADAFEINQRLGRGINMGNMLEAPSEGAWGVTFQDNYFTEIAGKGFQSVRIPIRWSAEDRTSLEAPYTVNETFFARVDHILNLAREAGLNAVINMHHYDELFQDATGFHRDRFLAIWRQVSERYKDYPDSLVFEVLNEPNTDLTAERWNTLFAEALAIIRETNPTRAVIVGTANWGGVAGLTNLVLPEDDNLILTVHYYNPFSFTHQGAEWVSGANAYLGTTWEGSYLQKISVVNEMAAVRWFSEKYSLPVFVGEFGAYSKADITSRATWTSYCARLFESFGFSWAYWEYCAGFGIYDPNREVYNDALVNALLSSDTSNLKLEVKYPEGIDLAENGTFSSGKQSWNFGVWDTTGRATAAVVDSELVVTVTKMPANPWGMQLQQGSISLVKDARYVLMFDAYADTPVTIEASVMLAEAPWTVYGGTGNAFLTSEKKTFSGEFIMKVDDPNGRISFNLGTIPAHITIDNVKLIQVGSNSPVINSLKSTGKIESWHVSNGKLNLSLDGFSGQNTKISLFTVQGRLVRSVNCDVKNEAIKIPVGKASGFYVLRIESAQKKLQDRILLP